MSFNFDDLAAAELAARFNLSDEVPGGLFFWEPFRSNRTFFDAWLVTELGSVEEMGPYGVNLAPEVERLQHHCELPNRQLIAVSHTHIGSSAAPGDVRISYHPDWGWSPLAHEFGHAFGLLSDEYGYERVLPGDPPATSNCSVATTAVGCEDWCAGPPARSAAELSAVDCITAWQETGSCVPWDGPCQIRYSNEGDPTCVNDVANCASLMTRESCTDDPINHCAWIDERRPDDYWTHNCIPTRLEVDIGSECSDGTGCFPGCGGANWFRSSSESVMGAAVDVPFNRVSRQILCDRIFEITGQRVGSCQP